MNYIMSFRRFGGLSFNPTNNIVKSKYSTSGLLSVTDQVGLYNSSIVFKSCPDIQAGPNCTFGDSGCTGCTGPSINLNVSPGAGSFYPALSAQTTDGSWNTAYINASYLSWDNTNLVLNATTMSANTFNALSDYRIKKNVQDLSLITHTVDNLKPVSYINMLTQKPDLGLIAHEVQKEFPMLVSGEKDGDMNQSINYQGLIPVLIKEIQELKRQMKKYELPSGSLIMFVGQECPPGFLWCDGSYIKDSYPQLCEILGNPFLPKQELHIIKY